MSLLLISAARPVWRQNATTLAGSRIARSVPQDLPLRVRRPGSPCLRWSACWPSWRCSPQSCCLAYRAATSRPRLEAYAIEVATLLKADRNAALWNRGSVAAMVDARGRTVRSGSSAHVVQVPDDVVFDALLPQRCNGKPAFSAISFFATGMSCGGAIRLTRFGSGFEVRVNWLTGGVDIVAHDNS